MQMKSLKRFYQAVIFDMDGLMIDTEPIYKTSWQRAASAVGYDLTDEMYLGLVGMNDYDAEQILLDTFGRGFPLGFFRELWPRFWHEAVADDGIPVKHGLVDLLDLLGSKNVPCGVATSTRADLAEKSLFSSNLGGRFRVIVTGEQVLKGKPAPDIYLRVAELMGTEAKSCIVLEDSDAGVLSAASAGMTVFMIPDLKPPSSDAAAAAYKILPSLMEARREISEILSLHFP